MRWWFLHAVRQGSGYLLAIGGLVWVFHDVQIGRFLASARAMNWWWLAPAVLCDVVSYLCQGIRWTYLLRPIGSLSPSHATQAIYVGLFTNELVPMRFGELVRAYLAARWMGMPLASLIPSMLVERLLDGVWLAFGIGGTAMLIPLPANVLHGVHIFGAVIVAAVLLFGLLLFCGPRRLADIAGEPTSSSRRSARIKLFLRRIAMETSRIGSPRILLLAGAFSVGLLIFQALAFWLVMISYGLSLPLGAGFAVFLLVHVGTAIPNAPANIGSFQFFTVLGLTLFGVEKNTAAAFSVAVFLILTLPLWALGFAALARSGASLPALRASIRDATSHSAK
jgi:uncharacterized protein (TIRG00374 family)